MIINEIIWSPASDGCAKRTPNDIYGVCFHWSGGGTGAQCKQTLISKGWAACFIIDENGITRRHADTSTTSTSCAKVEPHLLAQGVKPGYINRHFVQVEIAHRGLPPSLKKFPRASYMTNIRGSDVQVLAFTKPQMDAARELARFLSNAYAFPLKLPNAARGAMLTKEQLLQHRGVLGHYMVHPVKLDPAPELLEYVIS